MGGSNRLVGSNPTLSAGPTDRAGPPNHCSPGPASRIPSLDVRGRSTPPGPGGELGARDRRALRRPRDNRGVATVRAGELRRAEPLSEVRAQRPRLRRPLPRPACEVNAHVSAAGRRRSPTIRSAAASSARWCHCCRARLHDHRATGGAPATLPLPRALPAERLPRLHLHPPATRVAGVLLGGQARFFALRDHLRQPRGAGLVVPLPRPTARGCSRTAPSCGSIALPSNG